MVFVYVEDATRYISCFITFYSFSFFGYIPSFFPSHTYLCCSLSTRSNLHDYEGKLSTVEADDVALSAGSKSSGVIRRGSAGVVGSMMLLKSCQSMHAPYTQVLRSLPGSFYLKYYVSFQV